MTTSLRRALDPAVASMLDTSAAVHFPPAREQTPAQIRATLDDYVRNLWQGTPLEPVSDLQDLRVERGDVSVRVRVYTPPAPQATIVYFHGGGYVAGSIDTHDRMTRRLANGAQSRVVSVDYRLAPEHPYPAGPDDCYAATGWASEQFQDLPVLVAGDSAGGTMTAAVSFRARDEHGPRIAAQVLIYPALDPTQSGRSMREFATGYGLTRSDMAYYYEAYLPSPKTRAEDPFADPFRRQDLTGLPSTVVTTAGFDPLLDEGAEFAARLVRCGVPVVYQPEPSLIHGYLELAGTIPAAGRARDRLVRSIRRIVNDLTETR